MKTQDKNSEGSTLIIFMWLAIAIVLIVVIMAVIENKNQVKEPPAKPWINPDGSLPYETVKAFSSRLYRQSQKGLERLRDG